MLALVKGIEPRDQVEAMLAVQMAAVRDATMTFARRLADPAERAFDSSPPQLQRPLPDPQWPVNVDSCRPLRRWRIIPERGEQVPSTPRRLSS